MSNGICIVAQNNKQTDYVRQTYGLALSILASNPNTNISIITNDIVQQKYKKVFDHIIEIPWDDLAKQQWKIENRWKVYHCTPYRNTMVFDADMLVLDRINWDYHDHNNLAFTTNVTTYRQETSNNRYYRKTFDVNLLPNIYTAMYYFKKHPEVKEYFILLELIVKNWQYFYKKYTNLKMQNWCSMDVSAAIALKILGIQSYCTNEQLTFTHLKPHMQNFTQVPSKIFDECKIDIDDGIYINGYKQKGVLHYVEDGFLTEDVLSWLEEQV